MILEAAKRVDSLTVDELRIAAQNTFTNADILTYWAHLLSPSGELLTDRIEVMKTEYERRCNVDNDED